MALRRGKKNTFNVTSGKLLITSPEWNRDTDFDLMHELKACNGKWKSRAIMETVQFSDGKGLSPIGFEAWCDNPSASGKWRKLKNSAITDVAMIGVFDSGSYPRGKEETEHQYWNTLIPEIKKHSSSDKNFLISINKNSVIFETMSDGAYPVWVREGKGKKVDAVVIGFTDTADSVFGQKMFMDGDIPSGPTGTVKASSQSTTKDLIAECRSLWESYCERPGKTRLKAVIKHCELMAESTAKSVKEERARCMRSARREMKKLGMT